MTATIRAHNEGAAVVWGSGGSAYDRVSETIADALDHVVARLNPQTLKPSTSRSIKTTRELSGKFAIAVSSSFVTCRRIASASGKCPVSDFVMANPNFSRNPTLAAFAKAIPASTL